MSQSDYISKKKVIIQIQNQKESPSILDSSLYTNNKSYAVSIDISNSLITPSQLFQKSYLDNANCVKFLTCFNTNNRPNRIIHNSQLYSNTKKYVKNKKTVVGCINPLCNQ